ncbi:MAG: methyltransferase domain-containing protein [Desulfomicrobium sp.]|nr:methyltransferase domain-containing protein [Desulfomicrobium sp.]
MDSRNSLSRKIKAHLNERNVLFRECAIASGANPDHCIDKEFSQSALFMSELIPTIHRLYLSLPKNVQKTCLDVGPGCFSGTALLADLHSERSFNKLKLKVSAVDITKRRRPFQEILAPNVEFFCKDIFEIKERTWDFIICSHVIEHVPSPEAFINQLKSLANDFVLIACPWEEKAPRSKGHINTINENFVISVGGRDLSVYVNYCWGKHRKVCSFWVRGAGMK